MYLQASSSGVQRSACPDESADAEAAEEEGRGRRRAPVRAVLQDALEESDEEVRAFLYRCSTRRPTRAGRGRRRALLQSLLQPGARAPPPVRALRAAGGKHCWGQAECGDAALPPAASRGRRRRARREISSCRRENRTLTAPCARRATAVRDIGEMLGRYRLALTLTLTLSTPPHPNPNPNPNPIQAREARVELVATETRYLRTLRGIV